MPVHPRRHGEHLECRQWQQGYAGSSPQARGTPDTHLQGCLLVRFIPAGTGNTMIKKRLTVNATVHPRRHGEHDSYDIDQVNNAGSSPQARGTPS